MAFTNLQIDPDTLPRAEELDLKRLPPAHRRELLTQALITTGIFLLPSAIPLITPLEERVGNFVLAPPAVVIAFGLLLTGLALVRYRHKGYALREHDVVFRNGLFWRKTTVLPFDRVQHAEVTQGPLQRRFKLATLKFFTAGGTSVDLKIDGLLADEAERLREAVLRRSDRVD
ncbi:MAG: PH domain-containing protein [Xanthomonadales bacterium]|nr:PH domain-containing protein [Xanthomonadales bacterium]